MITVLYTVALMIRAEYKYHQFQGYLGLLKKETAVEETEAETSEPLSDETAGTESSEKEQEEQT